MLPVIYTGQWDYLCAKSPRWYSTLWDPMVCSLPGSSVRGESDVSGYESQPWISPASAYFLTFLSLCSPLVNTATEKIKQGAQFPCLARAWHEAPHNRWSPLSLSFRRINLFLNNVKIKLQFNHWVFKYLSVINASLRFLIS